MKKGIISVEVLASIIASRECFKCKALNELEICEMLQSTADMWVGRLNLSKVGTEEYYHIKQEDGTWSCACYLTELTVGAERQHMEEEERQQIIAELNEEEQRLADELEDELNGVNSNG